MDDIDTWIAFLPLVTDGWAVVGRSVVNKDDFEIGICLVNNGDDAFVKIFLDVIDRNND